MKNNYTFSKIKLILGNQNTCNYWRSILFKVLLHWLFQERTLGLQVTHCIYGRADVLKHTIKIRKDADAINLNSCCWIG